MAKTPHELKAALCSDAADAQRANGKIPDTRADEQFWGGVLDEMYAAGKLEHKRTKPKRVQRPGFDRERTIRTLKDAGCEIMSPAELRAHDSRRRATAVRIQREGSRARSEAFMLLRRLRLLRCFPEWAAKVWQAWEDGRKLAELFPDEPIRNLQAHCLLQVIEKSSETFGPWEALRKRSHTVLPSGTVPARNCAAPLVHPTTGKALSGSA